MPNINDNTSITIPLRNLLALVAGTAIAVTGYFHVTERVSMLEHEQVCYPVMLSPIVTGL